MLKKIFQHRVAKNTGALAILQIANYIAPLIVLVYLTRILGVEIYGVVAFSVGIVQLSGILTDFGFDLSAAHKVSVWRDKKKFISRFISAIFAIKLVVFVFVAFGVMLFSFLTKKYSDYSALFLYSILPIMGYGFQPNWFFMGIEKMRYITIFSITAKFLFVISVVFLVRSEKDYLWVPISNGAAQIIATLIALYFIYRDGYYLSFPRIKDVRYSLKVAFGVFVSRVSVALYMSSGVVLLGIFSTPAAVATYSLAEQLYKAMQSVFLPVILAVYPYMAKERNFSLYFKITGVCVLVSIIGVIVGYFVAPCIISEALGLDWLRSISVLNVFFIALVVNIMAALSGYPLAVAINQMNIANRSVFYGALVYLILGLFLIVTDLVTPEFFAVIMILAELYVLIYRGITIWPKVLRMQKLDFKGSV